MKEAKQCKQETKRNTKYYMQIQTGTGLLFIQFFFTETVIDLIGMIINGNPGMKELYTAT